MKLGLQGVTVVVSAGDRGVGFWRKCITGEANQTLFEPLTPPSCPYVLSVGGTEWRRRNATTPRQPWEKFDEVAATTFPTGGGFSNVFGTPDYQRDAVDRYFQQTVLPFGGYRNFSSAEGGVYHRDGRGYPDVAVVAEHQVIYAGGRWRLVGGTSLAAPLWASFLTLLNEARLGANKSTIGFVNPVLVCV